MWSRETATITVPDLDLRQSTRIHTSESDSNPVRTGPWNIKRSDSTDFAERMLGCMRTEHVGCNKICRVSQKLEPLRRNSEMDVASHGAVGTVASPSYYAVGGSDSPPDFPAVAASVVGFKVVFHATQTTTMINNYYFFFSLPFQSVQSAGLFGSVYFSSDCFRFDHLRIVLRVYILSSMAAGYCPRKPSFIKL